MGVISDNASPTPGDARRFAAFISYSHADAGAAAKLQRRLERYRLPKRIAETRASDATALGPIFRDREDLAAAASLSAAIRDAIARAEALIVMCSPHAVASPWVAAEIELFRDLHPDRPVLAALLSGEPAVSFPAALTTGGNEPLAADLRPKGDGEHLGFLKIVAGIAAVPLDTLIQRDAQRRIRRVTAITAGALTAMLIMGIMTTLALQARNEAARQRASAEGLVEYMLTDLREKLKGVGRLDVMESVNRRAMEHYKKQGDLEKLPVDGLERRARILHAMGEDDDKAGELVEAIAKFREAHRTTAALLSQEPDNPERIFAHAQSEYWVGQAAWRRNDRKTTERYWLGYVKQAQKLLVHDKDRARANMETGFAFGNLCELNLRNTHNLGNAEKHCRRSVEHMRTAMALSPDNTDIRIALANRYGWLADVLLTRKNYAEAREARHAEQELVGGLLSHDPKNFELRQRIIWPQFGLAQIAIAQAQYAESAALLRSIQEKYSELERDEPENVDLRRARTRALYMRAKALSSIDAAEARADLAQAKQIVANGSTTPEQRQAWAGYLEVIQQIEFELNHGGTEK